MATIEKRSYRDASGKVRQTKHYYLMHAGKKIPLGVVNKQAAQIRAAEILKNLELGQVGVEKYTKTLAKAPDDLIDDYIAELERLKRDPDHYKLVQIRLKRLFKGLRCINEMTPERIRKALGSLGVRARTQNAYRGHLNNFFKFLKKGLWGENPVEQVEKADVRRETASLVRRPLSREELRKLVETTRVEYRSMAYLLAGTTGLRRNELRTLTWPCVDFETGTITLQAINEKNGIGNVLFVPPGTMEALARYKSRQKTPKSNPRSKRPRVSLPDAVFPSVPCMARLRKDLEASGIDFERDGARVDFHALRGTCSTMMALSGIPMAVHQVSMRHQDPKMTMNVYTKVGVGPRQDAAARIDILADARPSFQLEEDVDYVHEGDLPPNVDLTSLTLDLTRTTCPQVNSTALTCTNIGEIAALRDTLEQQFKSRLG